ncbi:MAG: fructosamine kinase family protein [Cyclobacteriaceae bacterium]|nr:fructosamine kinase family protein [Cyclobacteriaceae bacterium]
MLENIPNEIKSGSIELLEKHFGKKVSLISFAFCSGGCINHGGKLTTGQGNFFLKWNDKKTYPEMFRKELHGLEILAQFQNIAVPKTMGHGEGLTYSYILMEYIEPGVRSRDYWEVFGQQLALLHRNSMDEFGLDEDNYIGSLVQKNKPSTSWAEFFMEQRIIPMLKLGRDTGKIDKKTSIHIENVIDGVLNIFPKEKPALLHGDLWGGNLITTQGGLPCLIDPAVYYGHREADLAFTFLFGGFDASFLKAYNEIFPLEPNFNERIDLYNVYPLLVHVNLFGTGYLNQVKSIISHFM